MRLIVQEPKKSLKPFLKLRPSKSEMDEFKRNLLRLLSKIDEIEREENQKIHIRDFLRDTFYKDNYEINTKDYKDLVIRIGKSNKDNVGVLFETKRPKNKIEMVTLEKPNTKAFQELILYYLNERVGRNIDIKYCIITNVYEWYIIESSYLDKLFFHNKDFFKQYDEWRLKKKVSKDTSLFFNEIAKPFIDSVDVEVPCTYFDIRKYKKFLKSNNEGDNKKLFELYKILSPYYLLKISFQDSNKLDERFYKELLHIIGLEEVKKENRLIIDRKQKGRHEGSLLENTITILETERVYKIPNFKSFGQTNSECIFNIALELCITWINRILFLKLLEGQLIKYHNDDMKYRFLNSTLIPDFAELYKIFHQVLAIKYEKRNVFIKDKFSHIPYLNSSLFEISDLEDITLKINSLDNRVLIDLMHGSVLTGIKKENNKLPLLEYLFSFLDAFNFSSDFTDDYRLEQSRTIINASVLGKVFEKINGYRDGSIFTPGLVTMYMCKQAIRPTIVQKFKEHFHWNVTKFNDIKNYLADKKSCEEILTFNRIINSIRICDPAVGSGHFLVSSLNEIIAIKAELGLLADDHGLRFPEFDISIENDELLVINSEGDLFEYTITNGKPFNIEAQRLQKTLFQEKQKIIENCLFGVDINANSVKICRLRLWIELLKSAFYKDPEYFELETLPNLDINIKCGNSLLSRFSLDDSLFDASRKDQITVSEYNKTISTYFLTTDKEKRFELNDIIENIKGEYVKIISAKDQRLKNIANLRGKIALVKHNLDLFGKRLSDQEAEMEEQRLTLQLENEVKKFQLVKEGILFKNSFEWRFEFPKVLATNGAYEGFDIIIGNPPYIESRSSTIDEALKDEIQNRIKIRRKKDANLITRGSDILIFFFELGLYLVKENGYFSFITQNSWLDTEYGFKFQQFLRRNTEILGIFDSEQKYFEESANINTIITLFKGKRGSETNKMNFVQFNVGLEKAPVEINELEQNNNFGSVIKIQQNDELLDKIKWGILLNSDDLTLDLQKRIIHSPYRINYDIRIGQGLNLSKEYIIGENKKEQLNLTSTDLIPFFTSDDGAPFAINSTKNFLLKVDNLSKDQENIILTKGIKIPDLLSSKRQIPKLILPRGIGRHFCAVNNVSSYSSSFVEVYITDNNSLTEKYLKYLWLFLNSSIGWLIREISGRKNLGGGMLKAEAIDLKSYNILFDFSDDLPRIDLLYEKLSKRDALNCFDEIKTTEHIDIDNIVFKKFNFTMSEKEKIIIKLSDLINHRITKSKTKL